MNIMHQKEVENCLHLALECSVYHSPTDLGLTYEELVEAGRGAGYLDGEIRDAIPKLGPMYFGGGNRKIQPNPPIPWTIYPLSPEPDYKSYAALDLVMTELNHRVRSAGAAAARIERSALVAIAVQKGIQAKDMEASIAVLLIGEQLVEKDGVISYKNPMVHTPLPSEQKSQGRGQSRRSEARERMYHLVGDIVARRTDGRSRRVEALDALTEALQSLGYGNFKVWWSLMIGEMRRADTETAPLSVLVLAAGVVEAVLTFVVKHARDRKLGPFQSADFEREPRQWRLDDLVKSASSGQTNAILDAQLKSRVDVLIRTRQRIHAGRMLSDHPQGPIPDLRPEEARDAKIVADLVARSVLDWLERHP